jgi:hypothetical protein
MNANGELRDHVILDEEDLSIASGYKWSIRSEGWVARFVQTTVQKKVSTKVIFLHREVVRAEERNFRWVRFRNGDKLDCRKSNLLCRPFKKAETDMNRNSYLFYRYGLRIEDYDELLLRQNGKCAICLHTPRERLEEENTRGGNVPIEERLLAVDHDHLTGNARGLLCWSCNTGLGHFKDNIESMGLAISYLVRHRDLITDVEDPITSFKKIHLFDKYGDISGEVIVDSDIYDHISSYRWSLTGHGGQAVRTITKDGRSRSIYLARYIMGITDNPDMRLKVCNKNRLDCRRSNLVVCSKRVDESTKWREVNLWRKYRITLDEYSQIMSDQHNLCGICKNDLDDNIRMSHIDHDHETQAIREILCSACNSGLGSFKEDTGRIRSAIQYLSS